MSIFLFKFREKTICSYMYVFVFKFYLTTLRILFMNGVFFTQQKEVYILCSVVSYIFSLKYQVKVCWHALAARVWLC